VYDQTRRIYGILSSEEYLFLQGVRVLYTLKRLILVKAEAL